MTGSGPYRFVPGEFNSGSRVVYEKFDAYVPRDEPPDWASGGKVAHFQRIEWHVIPDPATAANALMTGEVDWWEAPLPDLMPLLKANPDIAFQVGKPLGGLAFTRLNCLHPPFNDTKTRQAVLRATVQDDYMRAAYGDDPALWTLCKSLWPKRTPYYDEADAALMPGSLEAGRAALEQSGYAGEKVVLMQPTDRPAENAFSQITAELLRGLGMNVDVQSMDWGTLVQRRGTREPVEKGGWSLFHGSSFPATVCANPGSSYFVRGQGAKGWEGWWSSAEAEALASSWVNAPDEASRRGYARQLGHIALAEAATIPLGQSFDQTAFRRRITCIVPGARPYPWGVRPA
jgi:peptide/nickel transport system substrate-binding protein